MSSEVEQLKQKNEQLTKQIRGLLKSKHDYGLMQARNLEQIEIYRNLSDLGREINATRSLDKTLNRLVEFITSFLERFCMHLNRLGDSRIGLVCDSR